VAVGGHCAFWGPCTWVWLGQLHFPDIFAITWHLHPL